MYTSWNPHGAWSGPVESDTLFTADRDFPLFSASVTVKEFVAALSTKSVVHDTLKINSSHVDGCSQLNLAE